MPDQPVSRHLCLILEDNWVIAKGLTRQVMNLGFKQVECHVNCSDALSFLDQISPKLPDLAILDATMGQGETSLPVAQILNQLQVPFLIASGYGAQNDVTAQFPNVVTLQKPVPNAVLAETVDQILGVSPD